MLTTLSTKVYANAALILTFLSWAAYGLSFLTMIIELTTHTPAVFAAYVGGGA
jgi:hypothetical protein